MKENNERVTLTVTREQALLMERALELYARLHIGQTGMIPECLMDWAQDDFRKKRDLADEALQLALKIMFGTNQYNQPDIKEKSEEQRRAWLLYTTLRYARAWHDEPDASKHGWSVMYDEPYNDILGEFSPVCKIEEV